MLMLFGQQLKLGTSLEQNYNCRNKWTWMFRWPLSAVASWRCPRQWIQKVQLKLIMKETNAAKIHLCWHH